MFEMLRRFAPFGLCVIFARLWLCVKALRTIVWPSSCYCFPKSSKAFDLIGVSWSSLCFPSIGDKPCRCCLLFHLSTRSRGVGGGGWGGNTPLSVCICAVCFCTNPTTGRSHGVEQLPLLNLRSSNDFNDKQSNV